MADDMSINGMEDTNVEQVGDIMYNITKKHGWYHKINNDNIVDMWRVELGDSKYLDMALSILRATSQGSCRSSQCTWDTLNPEGCRRLFEGLRSQIKDSDLDEHRGAFTEKLRNSGTYDFNDVKCTHLPIRCESCAPIRAFCRHTGYPCDDCLINGFKHILDNPGEYEAEDVITQLNNEVWDGLIDLSALDEQECGCVPPDCELDRYVEYNCDNIIPGLKEAIHVMADNEPIDWHPYSNEMVRDIIHPSMYCLSRGKDVDEKERYQWLPSEFSIDNEGGVKVESYINNLDHQRYPSFVKLVEEAVSNSIGPLEDVLCRGIDGNLQVIVKVASIHLDEERSEYEGGSWHIEGVPYEHIVATSLYYVESRGLTESYLEFRKPVYINEEGGELRYPQSDGAYTTHHYGITPGSHHNGAMNRYLGLVKCVEGSSVVFPNTLQHRVKGFRLAEGEKTGVRTILALFIIDPDHRITSTADIGPQQATMKHSEALHNRERLMYFRKYYVDVMNRAVFEREYSLCEH